MTRLEYKDWIARALSKAKENEDPDAVRNTMRYLSTHSVYFMLVYILGRSDADKDWVWERCMEVQNNPDGYIDIWAREHYKSTIITFTLTIMDICRDPEVKACIFSYNRPTAKAFLRQIKVEFETNEKLKWMFPDVLYQDPKKESPRWSEDAGLVVKRKGNPKEGTLEAYGLVDGQPTGKHYSLMIYDDVVTKESVTNPEMIEKVTYSWEMSINVGSEGCRKRYVGTRYHYADTYKVIMERKSAKQRIYPCMVNNMSVLYTQEYIAEKRRDMGGFTFSCQMMCDPKEEGTVGFKEEWLKYWSPKNLGNLNLYIIVDPANKKNKKSDYTSIWVVGLGSDKNYYIITMIRDKLNLTERTRTLFALHQQFDPKNTFYEQYGMQTDIEHIRYVQAQTNYRFNITEFGGNMAKEDRILSLLPLFEDGRIYLPENCIRRNYEQRQEDLTQVFKTDEYLAFPFCEHDDMLDSLARITDSQLMLIFPDKVHVLTVIEETLGLMNNMVSMDTYDPL